MNNKPYDKNFLVMLFDLEHGEFNALEEVQHDPAFHEDFEKWSDLYQKTKIEDLEEFAEEWFNRRKLN